MGCDRCNNKRYGVMIVYNNQQQLTGHCSFQKYSVLLPSHPRNNGNQGEHAIISIHEVPCHLKHINMCFSPSGDLMPFLSSDWLHS